jgi:hypothetical protein
MINKKVTLLAAMSAILATGIGLYALSTPAYAQSASSTGASTDFGTASSSAAANFFGGGSTSSSTSGGLALCSSQSNPPSSSCLGLR